MPKPKCTILAVVADTHIGSTLGLCPIEGVQLPDTGRYTPSPAQQWVWENWLAYWEKVRQMARDRKARIIGLHLGDSVEGEHHGTTQLVTADPEAQAYMLTQALHLMKKTCQKIYVCRGTEAHIGPGGDDATGRWIGAEKHPDSETWAAHEWNLDVNGCRIQARHHASLGYIPWTRHTAATRLASHIFLEHADYASRSHGPFTYPHIALRGHQHRYSDSGTAQPVRAVYCPSWQLCTNYVARITQTSLADIGGLILVVEPDGRYEIHPVLFTPEMSRVVRV